jgi:hypothetical protein
LLAKQLRVINLLLLKLILPPLYLLSIEVRPTKLGSESLTICCLDYLTSGWIAQDLLGQMRLIGAPSLAIRTTKLPRISIQQVHLEILRHDLSSLHVSAYFLYSLVLILSWSFSYK